MKHTGDAPRAAVRVEDGPLRPLFPLGSIQTEHGLVARLTAAYESECAARLALGDALYGHMCNRPNGDTAEADMRINDYVLYESLLSAAVGHHVVSAHLLGPIRVEVSTNLGTGKTAIRSATPQRATKVPRAGGSA